MGQLTATASCALEVSVVMPCLNEADTLATCIKKPNGPCMTIRFRVK